jgi:hypothetical protein
MSLQLSDLVVDLENLDLENIFASWQWRVNEQKGLVFISKLGDMFLLGEDEGIYWLQTDCGDLVKVANNLQLFESLLTVEENLDNWFLPSLIEKLEASGKKLKPNQVYSYKKLPVIGGEYSIDNIEPTDISVHFAFSGQICEQIQNLPDGTNVKLTFKKAGN